ncbi:hypothetical protein EYC80_011019 [Monilinia laxa]|uniref:C2H2-type domain-containing protein n=1 Tax=Monilinia laxa TaxID=61186 RepID=A0A5N6JQD2_MONLA|nr:hypothetical protein EYC80_011019 [Monilinia laxa]
MGFRGNRQKTIKGLCYDMSNGLGSLMPQHAGNSLIFIALCLCYFFLIALIIRLKPMEPSHTLLHTSRQPKFRPEIGTGRHARLFGVGWFLEWPGGQRPLNSTWPWSGVKLSVLVLWGVCWMFYMRIECWQQAQPYASHNHSLPQLLSRKAPGPLSFHSCARAKNYLPLDQQTVIKQEPYDNNLFVSSFDQYHSNHIQDSHLHPQRPSDSNWPSIFNPYLNNTSTSPSTSTRTWTRINNRNNHNNNIVNQETFQPIQKSHQLQYTTTREYIQAAAPSTKQMLLAMPHNLTSNSQDISSKSPALSQGSYRNKGITDDLDNINSTSHANRLLPGVSNLQPSITSVGSPDQAERREYKNHKNQNGGGTQDDDDVLLLSVAGTNTSPHFSAQGKHHFEAGPQSQGYQQLHYQESNNQLQSDQAGLYERGEQIPYEYPPGSNIFQNYDPPRPNNNMSLSYESRAFMPDTQYPMQMAHETQEQDEFKPHDEPHYPSPPPPMSENPYTAQPMTETPEHQVLELPELPKDEEEAPSPGRSKPVPKPDREVTKDANGRFYCTWPGCTEEIKDFNRKCEWSKHMDKHDRPYRCKETGCEKLPGFTYSGGLLRHEREVHGKHGGPKKQLNCPHPNCKRHTGKGFSRQENLNEHLRRVHTDGVMSQMTMEETEEDASQAVITGIKRKRGNSKEDTNELETLREEIKKIKAENDELKRNSQAQQAQTAEVMRQLVELQNLATLQHPRMNAPQANM